MSTVIPRSLLSNPANQLANLNLPIITPTHSPSPTPSPTRHLQAMNIILPTNISIPSRLPTSDATYDFHSTDHIELALSILAEALCGTRGKSKDQQLNQQRIAVTGLYYVSKILRKNTDYKNSVFKTPILAPTLPAKTAILVRMSDKINRYQNLSDQDTISQVTEETIDETMGDLAAYGLLYLARPEEPDANQVGTGVVDTVNSNPNSINPNQIDFSEALDNLRYAAIQKGLSLEEVLEAVRKLAHPEPVEFKA